MSEPVQVSKVAKEVVEPKRTLQQYLADLAGQRFLKVSGTITVAGNGTVTLSLAPVADAGNAFVATVKENELVLQ